jgi:hypothetical protein
MTASEGAAYRRLCEMRAAELLTLLRSVVARLALLRCRPALFQPRCVADGAASIDCWIGDVLREEGRRGVSARAVVVGGLLVDNDRSDKIPDRECVPAGSAHAGVAGLKGRLFTYVTEVIVAATCSVPVHLGHCRSLALCPVRAHTDQRIES